jgi:RNA polymerase sigma factor (sigma-70 family)
MPRLSTAQQRRVEQYLSLARAAANRYAHHAWPLNWDECYSVACWRLCQAARAFDASANTSGEFSAYAWTACCRGIIRHIEAARRSRLVTAIADTDDLDADDDPLETATSPEPDRQVVEVMESLAGMPPICEWVVTARYGLRDGRRLYDWQIARILGLPVDKVRQLAGNGKSILRKLLV